MTDQNLKVKARNSSGMIRAESLFKRSLVGVGIAMIVLVVGLMITLIIESVPSMKSLGIKYLWGRTWDPVNNVYGALPFLIGTLLTSFLALIISIPFSFAIAIYLGEYNPKGWLSNFLKNTVELIAAVPSVIYGFWGLLVLVPLVRALEIKVGVLPYGIGIFTASLILLCCIAGSRNDSTGPLPSKGRGLFFGCHPL
jgi:phosphate transport system permease protein